MGGALIKGLLARSASPAAAPHPPAEVCSPIPHVTASTQAPSQQAFDKHRTPIKHLRAHAQLLQHGGGPDQGPAGEGSFPCSCTPPPEVGSQHRGPNLLRLPTPGLLAGKSRVVIPPLSPSVLYHCTCILVRFSTLVLDQQDPEAIHSAGCYAGYNTGCYEPLLTLCPTLLCVGRYMCTEKGHLTARSA